MDRESVVTRLEEIAVLLEIAGANPFRVRAYHNGARVIEALTDFSERLAAGTLGAVKGLGKGLIAHIDELRTTGMIAELETLRRDIPRGVVAMTQIPNVGPKRAHIFWKELGLTSVPQLVTACESHAVAALPRMGEKIEAKILQAIAARDATKDFFLYPEALAVAKNFVEALRECPAVRDIAMAGSVRRHKEIVHDVDLVVGTADAAAVTRAFCALPQVAMVLGSGDTKTSVKSRDGLQIDLRCVAKEIFPCALHHFTGSKEHNTALRARAQQRQLKLSEYGLFRVHDGQETLLPCTSEADIYRALDLQYIPPELREDRGEIERAEKNALPNLIVRENIQGVFHCHSTYSDGRATLREMAIGAKHRGWKYLGVSDHSQSAKYAHGLEIERVHAQLAEIEALNAEPLGVKIFKGIEVDILKDGTLDYDDDLLARFDFVIASIHTHFTMSSVDMTARICRALAHPAVRVLAHPSGRLLLSREAYAMEMETVLRTAGGHRVVVEINGNPRRADLDWRFGNVARECGVQTMISPDAHTVGNLDNIDFGVGYARKGGWSAADVVNTWSLEKVEQWCRKK